MATENIESGEPGERSAPRARTAAEQTNSRYGLILFAIYFALYAVFMAINVMAPEVMAKPALAGMNVAIVFGFGLIVSALVLALIYMRVSRAEVEVEDGR